MLCYCYSVTQSCSALCDPMDCSTPGFPVHNLPEFAQTYVQRVNDSIQPSHPLPPPSVFSPSVFPSIKVFSKESAFHIRWPKYWSFSFSISPSNEYSGLISFRIDWFDLLAVQGTPAMIFFLIEDSRGLRRTETSQCTMTAFTQPPCLCSATFSISGHWPGPHWTALLIRLKFKPPSSHPSTTLKPKCLLILPIFQSYVDCSQVSNFHFRCQIILRRESQKQYDPNHILGVGSARAALRPLALGSVLSRQASSGQQGWRVWGFQLSGRKVLPAVVLWAW